MKNTLDIRAAHNLYKNLPEKERDAVDDAYSAARLALVGCGFKVANDDRAEELVAAITQYLIDSKN